MNNISNRSSVLPILCEHGHFSAILERTQSLDRRRVDDETGYRVVLFQHLTGHKRGSRSKVGMRFSVNFKTG